MKAGDRVSVEALGDDDRSRGTGSAGLESEGVSATRGLWGNPGKRTEGFCALVS